MPSLDELKLWHKNWIQWRNDLVARQKEKSTFYTAFLSFGDHIKWLDETAGTGLFANFGWFSRRAWALWWKDRELYDKCLNGLFTPAIWRLFDMGKRKPMDWDKAREQIFADNERAERQIRERLAVSKKLV
jgi:dimethylaniline monooxygenase (N-oxide forming)